MNKLTKVEGLNSQKFLLALFMNDEKGIIKQSFMGNEKLGYIAAVRRGMNEMAERLGNEINVSLKLKNYVENLNKKD